MQGHEDKCPVAPAAVVIGNAGSNSRGYCGTCRPLPSEYSRDRYSRTGSSLSPTFCSAARTSCCRTYSASAGNDCNRSAALHFQQEQPEATGLTAGCVLGFLAANGTRGIST